MSGTRTARATKAHAKAVQFEVADIARYLQETLGQKLTAHIAGVSDYKIVGKWASGAQRPRPEAEKNLRTAFQIFHLLQSEDSPHTVRAWFIGLNPQLDDEAPADVIRDGRHRDALTAARAYIAGG